MRVRISYSVDLKDVPLECARMLYDAVEQMKETGEEIDDVVKLLDDDKAHAWIIRDRIKKCREKLAKLDSVLADNDMILEGYFSASQPEELEDVSEG